MSKFKIKGLKELQRNLNKMKRAAEELEAGVEVSFDVLFNQTFMTKYTQFSSFDEFLKAGNFIVESQKDFEAIPDEDMDAHVLKTTRFKDWEEMLGKATEEYVAKKLGF